MTDLILERQDQPNETGTVGPIMITPPISEDYWLFRVRVGDGQAIVGFPKFHTIGIGFAVEEDWNTNLPYTCDTHQIFAHIKHNKGDNAIADADCMEAIRMVQEAAREFKARVSE